MGDHEAMASERALQLLRASALFASLDDAAGGRLARHVVRRRYRAGEVIFHQGDPGDRLHVIDAGRVRILVQSEDGREGTLAILGPGDLFGELALLDGVARSATAVALGAAETVTLGRDAFASLVDEDAALRWAVLGGVARSLRRLTGQVADLHFLDVRGRLASTLVRLARDVDPDRTEMVELPPLTQSDLAALVAGTRQRVNQTLHELVREGLVLQRGRHLTVVDVERLAGATHW